MLKLRCFSFLALPLTLASGLVAQDEAVSSTPKPVVFDVRQDHQQMMDQLGISKLRPGRGGDSANSDESKANPYPVLPDLMTAKSGVRVTNADQWLKVRRPEIVADFEREVLGRIPEGVPAVNWEIVKTITKTLGETEVIEKRLVGTVDNSGCPEIDVSIMMSLILPKAASGGVPVLMEFGFTRFGPDGEDLNVGGGRFGRGSRGPSKQQILVEAGWGCATVNAYSIQDDAGGERESRFGPPRGPGGGLTRGIIGLTNNGQPRQPDHWGSLRAWGWGASRALDYLETDQSVDATRVGIDGVSRFGKAALVTMAFDQRFASVLVGSSGEGGASLYRRNFGESVENLTASGEYHWMAGNFLKYGTEESTFGAKDASDLPVDAHMLIALCAPRPTFISYGVPEKGDAHWLDQQGSFMAAVAAQPAFRVLGARTLGRSDDYMSEKMPPVNTDLLDGELAWRQHDGGHTDMPNIPHFIKWMNRLWAEQDAGATSETAAEASEQPAYAAYPRGDGNSKEAHRQLLAKTRQGQIDVYFQGDSITRRWGALDYPKLQASFEKHFFGWNAANFAWGGDNTHNILWRMQNGELDGVSPKVVVLQAGTNNLPWRGPAKDSHVEDVVSGIDAIVGEFQRRVPDAKIVLTAVFPRSQNIALASTIGEINGRLEELAQKRQLRFLNINPQLSDDTGKMLQSVSSDGLHLGEKGYEIWAAALKPILTDVLGPPNAVDDAPPATGDPSAAARVASAKQAAAPSKRLTTPGGAEVPEAVRIQRPTEAEVELAKAALKNFAETTDSETADVLKSYPSLLEVRLPPPNTAIVPNLARFFRQKHRQNVAVAEKGEAELLLMGDSITDFWRNDSGAYAGSQVLQKHFGQWNIANFGIAGDTTQGVLYRLRNGEGEGISPRAIMMMIGTNNTGRNTAAEIAEGIGAIVLDTQKRFSKAKILLLAVFPRGKADDPVREKIAEINTAISQLHDGERVHYLDIGEGFLDDKGDIPTSIMVDGLHPSAEGYEIWAQAVKKHLQQLMEE